MEKQQVEPGSPLRQPANPARQRLHRPFNYLFAPQQWSLSLASKTPIERAQRWIR